MMSEEPKVSWHEVAAFAIQHLSDPDSPKRQQAEDAVWEMARRIEYYRLLGQEARNAIGTFDKVRS
jgi:hypothetical protein